MRPLGLPLLLATLATLAGCRDATEPFESRDRHVIATDPVRLTFSSGDDRSPTWSAGSDSVYYSASVSELDPESQGVLLSIPRQGGLARALVASQPDRAITAVLLEPAQAPGSAALAFIQMVETAPSSPCSYQVRSCAATLPLPSPGLVEAWLGVAPSPEAAAWTQLVELRFEGAATQVESSDNVTTWLSRYLPHQERWAARRLLPAKPSWSPDGQRIAVVDGDGLSIVDVATGATRLLAAGDVANPAWSPDGSSIAFDRVVRLDSVGDECVYLIPDPKTGELVPNCRERRIHYTVTSPRIVLIDADGSAGTELAVAADPAWSPDGRWLYVVRYQGIARLDSALGTLELVPGLEFGEEPAISPDGRWLAFTRYDRATGTRDVWVAELPPPQGD